MNNQIFFPEIQQKTYIAQVNMSPESVVGKSSELQVAMNWGLKISIFIFSMYILASIIRYILNISRQ